MVAVQPFKPV